MNIKVIKIVFQLQVVEFSLTCSRVFYPIVPIFIILLRPLSIALNSKVVSLYHGLVERVIINDIGRNMIVEPSPNTQYRIKSLYCFLYIYYINNKCCLLFLMICIEFRLFCKCVFFPLKISIANNIFDVHVIEIFLCPLRVGLTLGLPFNLKVPVSGLLI